MTEAPTPRLSIIKDEIIKQDDGTYVRTLIQKGPVRIAQDTVIRHEEHTTQIFTKADLEATKARLEKERDQFEIVRRQHQSILAEIGMIPTHAKEKKYFKLLDDLNKFKKDADFQEHLQKLTARNRSKDALDNMSDQFTEGDRQLAVVTKALEE